MRDQDDNHTIVVRYHTLKFHGAGRTGDSFVKGLHV